MNEEKKTSPSNSKLSTIFLVVLGLHVVVIVLILAYNLLKGDTDTQETDYFGSVEQSEPYRPMSPMGDRPAPRLETEPADAEQPVAPNRANVDRPMSMPSTSDPIWAVGTMQPRQPEQVQDRAEETARSVASATTERVTTTETTATPEASLEDEVRQTASTGSYKVVKGDSLSKIGNRFGVSVADLKRVNKIDGSLIRIGQTLQIPGASTSSSAVAALPQQAAVSNTVSTHVVKKGETLWKIARQYKVNPNDLAKVNGIDDPTQLKIGTSLNIPGAQQMAQPVQRQQTPRVENADMAMRSE